MKKGQKSKTGNYENVLCPFTYMNMTQDANGKFSHQGSTALDLIGSKSGKREAYYAPVKVKCVNVDKKYAFVWWQSVNKVRYADQTIDYVTFMCGHDDSINAYKGMILEQGIQLGNMGKGGNATGVHCHIEVGRGKQTTWKKNKQGVWCIPKAVKFENVFFMDNTTIKNCKKSWKYLKSIPKEKPKTKTMTVLPKEGLNIRSKASTTGKILMTLKKGAKVTYLKDAGSSNGYTWAQIKYNGKTGYVAKKYLK